VKNKILNKFESVKLKNKSPICLANHMFFFIYSKPILMSYYKYRVEKLSKRNNSKKIEQEQGGVNNGNAIVPQSKIFPTPQVKPLGHNTPHVHLKSQSKKKKILASNKKASPSVEKLSSQGKSNLPINYQLDNILQPPSRTNFAISDNENILDDLIEAPSKIKIASFNK
jgi:hypothetical protein